PFAAPARRSEKPDGHVERTAAPPIGLVARDFFAATVEARLTFVARPFRMRRERFGLRLAKSHGSEREPPYLYEISSPRKIRITAERALVRCLGHVRAADQQRDG